MKLFTTKCFGSVAFVKMEAQCNGCKFHYLKPAMEFWESDEKAIKFLRQHGVLLPRLVLSEQCREQCSYAAKSHVWPGVDENERKYLM